MPPKRTASTASHFAPEPAPKKLALSGQKAVNVPAFTLTPSRQSLSNSPLRYASSPRTVKVGYEGAYNNIFETVSLSAQESDSIMEDAPVLKEAMELLHDKVGTAATSASPKLLLGKTCVTRYFKSGLLYFLCYAFLTQYF